jgi:hypothetical protein
MDLRVSLDRICGFSSPRDLCVQKDTRRPVQKDSRAKAGGRLGQRPHPGTNQSPSISCPIRQQGRFILVVESDRISSDLSGWQTSWRVAAAALLWVQRRNKIITIFLKPVMGSVAAPCESVWHPRGASRLAARVGRSQYPNGPGSAPRSPSIGPLARQGGEENGAESETAAGELALIPGNSTEENNQFNSRTLTVKPLSRLIEPVDRARFP